MTIGGNLRQQRDGILVLFLCHQQAATAKHDRLVFRVNRFSLSQQRCRGLEVVGLNGIARSDDELLQCRRDHLIKELSDRLWRLGANKLADDLPVTNANHKWNTLGPQCRCHLWVFIDVDFDELELAIVFGFQIVEHWPELAAGAAPGRPEIDNHGYFLRAFDDPGFKLGIGNINWHSGTPSLQREIWATQRLFKQGQLAHRPPFANVPPVLYFAP